MSVSKYMSNKEISGMMLCLLGFQSDFLTMTQACARMKYHSTVG